MSQGFYLLANDCVLEFAERFVESMRRTGSRLPLAVIPFDDACDEIERLTRPYRSWFGHADDLTRYDRLGEQFCPGDASCFRTFRKLVVFDGPFDEFAYFDADIVLLVDPAELLEPFSRSRAQLAYTDRDPKEVYPPGRFREEMLGRYKSPCFNTGFFLSRRGVLSWRDLVRVAASAGPNRRHLSYRNDQGFLNYCVDVLGIETLEISELADGLTRRQWAAREGIVRRDDGVFMADAREPDYGCRFPFVHWAGFDVAPSMPQRGLFEEFRSRAAHEEAL
ncbi:MAG: hypothetical protein M3217_00130 [Actinomycetota bacterium]|nr:hypothetical protein [Actinomycetota bacterium]